jgi:hypothetical protein
MRKVSLLVIALISLFLVSCGSSGDFRVVNQTSFPLYVTVDDQAEIVIPGGAEYTFTIPTRTEWFMQPDIETEVPVHIVGETYHIYDEDEEVFTDTTTITVNTGETLNAYIHPNRASFKVKNLSNQTINRVLLYKHNFVAGSIVAQMDTLLNGESQFKRVDYATPSDNFYYYAEVYLADSTMLTYGDTNNILLEDQQFLVTVTPAGIKRFKE